MHILDVQTKISETHPTRDNLGRVNASNTVAALERADSFLASISQLTDTCVIPSSGEVSSSVLPSKPLHRLMFKKVCSNKENFSMVVVPVLPHAEFRPNDHQENVLHFTVS